MEYSTNAMTEEACVKRGVEWLDANVRGWEKRIVVKEFDIGSGCKCVCGFVFQHDADAFREKSGDTTCRTGFDYACRAYEYDKDRTLFRFFDEDGHGHTWTDWHGFDAGRHTQWEELGIEWLKILAERGYE